MQEDYIQLYVQKISLIHQWTSSARDNQPIFSGSLVIAYEKKQPLESVNGILINTSEGLKATKPVNKVLDAADEHYLMPRQETS